MESVTASKAYTVRRESRAWDLNASELDQIGQDPFRVPYALPMGPAITIVTREVSKPREQRQNRKVPAVCVHFGVRCISDFQFSRGLDFKISSAR